MYSYTVISRPQTPAFEVPYVVAIIDLAEGYQMMSNMVDVAVEDVQIGLPVEVTFVEVSGLKVPMYQPRSTVSG